MLNTWKKHFNDREKKYENIQFLQYCLVSFIQIETLEEALKIAADSYLQEKQGKTSALDVGESQFEFVDKEPSLQETMKESGTHDAQNTETQESQDNSSKRPKLISEKKTLHGLIEEEQPKEDIDDDEDFFFDIAQQ